MRIEKISEQRYYSALDSLTTNSPDSLIDVCGPSNNLHPIIEGKEHYMHLEVPVILSPQQQNVFNTITVDSSTISDDISVKKLSKFFLGICLPQRKMETERNSLDIVQKLHMYIPLEHREPKNTAKLNKVSTEINVFHINSVCKMHLFIFY